MSTRRGKTRPSRLDADLDIPYWRTATGREVDFVLGDMQVAIECKASARVHDGDLAGLRALAGERRVQRRFFVSLEKTARRLDDGIEILPWQKFVKRLWDGEIVR